MTGRRTEDELFSAAYEGELDAVEQAAFDRRLAEDPALRSEYDDFRRLLSGVDRVYADAPVPDLMPGIRAKLKQRRGLLKGDRLGQLRGRGRIQPLLLAMVLAVLLLLLWMVMFTLHALNADSTVEGSNTSSSAPRATDSDR